MSDEVREQIEGIMRGAGMSEPEARASYHLGKRTRRCERRSSPRRLAKLRSLTGRLCSCT